MASLWLGLVRLFAGLRRGLRDPEFRAIILLIVIAIAIGAAFFRIVEHWLWIDAIYFSVMALTTVGDATLAPTTAIAKIFTMAYSICGIGLMLAFLSRLSTFREPRDGE
ncbi:potassium channel family protein [Tardiphaga sp.]|uniref:potassium channel family protein n=1 Tax=Tardiphaga sp. TaxID=1926292 RepID=UPI002611D418|nr:potassium channel family protein [Tardiphaga sp.]MDB5617225.1 Potassium channel protein [Tardiphaga sp.]